MKPCIHITTVITIAIAIISIPLVVSAQVPQTLSYQGVITTDGGQPADDGDYTIHFRLYAGPESGEPLWSESQTVDVTNGLFNVLLGSAALLDLPFDQPYYLGVTIGESSELTPRTALSSSAYSFRARTIDDGQVVTSLNGLRDNISLVAGDNIGLTQNDSTIVISALINAGEGTITGITAGEGLTGGGSSGGVTLSVAEGGITSSMLADSAVTAHKLAPGSVTETALADSAVTATKIHPGINITTTGTVQAGSFVGDGSGLTGLPAGEISLPISGEVSDEPAAISVSNTSASGVTFGVYGLSRSTNGRGVFGQATAASGITNGIWGESQSPDGRGVVGVASATSGNSYGVAGTSQSTAGRGVSGLASATSGTAYGVAGTSQSTAGRGVFGLASAASGFTYGVEGLSISPDGRGVFGWASASSGTTFGVYGQSNSTEGRGVFGWASRGIGFTVGVEGRSQSTDGRGVFGVATATSGITYGVYGRSSSTNGRGVYGQASAASGVTYGVEGRSNSSEGFAAYFTGVTGSRNYFQRSVGIGTDSPEAMLHLLDASSEISIKLKAGNSWTAQIQQTNNSYFNFMNGGNVRMTIRAGGQVGIGTEEPGSFRLAVNGDAAKPGGGSWSVFSDQRLKRDIRQLEPGALDRLLQLQGYTFEYHEEAIENRLALPGRQTGLIAQEVLEVFPDWVGNDEEGYLYVTERGLTALLIEALRELKSEKDNEISALHQRIQQLEMQLIRTTSAE